MKVITTDKNGDPIYNDSIVKAAGGLYLIEKGEHREKEDCGSVYGYYVPDYCEVVKDSEQ